MAMLKELRYSIIAKTYEREGENSRSLKLMLLQISNLAALSHFMHQHIFFQ